MPVIDKIAIDETTYEINVTGGYIKTGQLANSTRGQKATIEGIDNVASGEAAHAEGYHTSATGDYSHAEGSYTCASGFSSHAEGQGSTASASKAHAEGANTYANNINAHAEGTATTAGGEASHSEGGNTYAKGLDSHSEGNNTTAQGNYSHAEGAGSYAITDQSHAEGYHTTAQGNYSHSEGMNTSAVGHWSHAEGNQSTALGDQAHSEGYRTYAGDDYSHAEGSQTCAPGLSAHSENYYTKAIGDYSHAEGNYTTANGDSSHAEGCYTYANSYAHAENSGKAYGSYSHAEGSQTTATGSGSHAEGNATYAKGDYSHVEGGSTTAEGYYSHAQGNYTTAKGDRSTAAGKNTIAGYNDQFVLGYYNDNREDNLFEIGNGDYNSRSNAFEVDKDGNLTVSGTITDGEGNVLTDLTNYIQKSETPGFIRNDGTIDNIEYVEAEDTFKYKVWHGETDFFGNDIWTDGDNIYYSSGENQYVLDQTTDTQSTKTQNISDNINDILGTCIQTDGTDIYLSNGEDQYVLDKTTSTQNKKTQIGLTEFDGVDIQSDGTNIYYSRYWEDETHSTSTNYQYVLDIATSTQTTKTQHGFANLTGQYVQTYNDTIYYSEVTNYLGGGNQYILNVDTDTWEANDQGEPSSLNPKRINGTKVQFYKDIAYYDSTYMLNKDTNMWLNKEQTGLLTDFDGDCIQTDGTHIYYSGMIGMTSNRGHYVLNKATDYLVAQPIPGLIKNDGSVDTNTYLTSADLGDYVEKSSTAGLIKNDGTIDTNTYLTANTLPTATTSNLGVVKPDGITIFVKSDGTITGADGDALNAKIDDRTSYPVDSQSPKTQGNIDPNTYNIQTDGENIYSSASGYINEQYILDKATSTQNHKEQNGYTDVGGNDIQTDGEVFYQSEGTDQYVLDKTTDTQSPKTQNRLTDFNGGMVQKDGDNIYYSDGTNKHYILDKATSTQNTKTQNGYTNFNGNDDVQTDGTDIYLSYSNHEQYVLDRSTSTQREKTQTGLNLQYFYGYQVQTDGENIYWSDGELDDGQYILNKNTIKTKIDDLETETSTKADKVSSATDGHFAGLDANGNLTDSGYSASDFNTPIATTSTAGKVKPDGSSITVDANGVISAIGGSGVTTSVIGPEENESTASQAYTTGDYFIKDDAFCIAITDISSGAPLSEGSNYDETNIASVLKNAGSEIKVVFDQTPSSSTIKTINFLANLYNTYMKQDFPENQDVIDLIKRALSKKYCILLQSTNGGSYTFLQFTNASVSNNVNTLVFTSMYGTNDSLSFSSSTDKCNAYINGASRNTSNAINFMYRVILIENC